MELRHLRYFIAVAEEQNITRAAARLHVAQPSLSRQIRDLESELEVPLFEHAPRTVRLTEAGRFFLQEAREVVERFSQAVESVREFAGMADARFHLGYAPSLTTRILPRALRKFQTILPKTLLSLHDLTTEQMLAGLRDESLDAALIVKPSTPALHGISYREIIRFAPCVAMPHSHPLARTASISISQLDDQALIAYTRTEYPEYHLWLTRVFQGVRLPRIIAEHDSSTSLIAAIESGCGVAVIQNGFENLAGSRLVIRVLQESADAAFSFGIAWRKEDASSATREFIKAACGAAREE